MEKKEKHESDLISIEDENNLANQSPEDPKSWPRKKKNLVLLIISLAGVIASISSTIFYPAVPIIIKELNTTEVLANGIVGVYLVFMGLAPLGWSSYSDAFETRRNVYLVSFIIYIVGSIICAVSKNIWLMLVMRSIQASGSSSVLSLGAGTISDIFHPAERGRSYGIFYLGPLVGPVVGPMIGGFMTDYLGWRWVFWINSMIGGLVLILMFFLLPETFAPSPNNKTSNSQRSKRFCPLSALSLLKYPNMNLVLIYISILFALIYVQNTLLGKTYTRLYHLSISEVGIAFLSPGSGYMVGSILGGKWTDYIYIKAKVRNKGVGYPEMRLHSIWIGIFVITVSYICYGWFLEAGLHIAFPTVALFLGGFSDVVVINAVSTYMVDAFPGKSASAIAVNYFCRALASSTSTFAAVPFENAVGTGWTYTILVCVSTIGIFCLIAVYYKGKYWREKYL